MKFVEDKLGGLWGEQHLVALPTYVGDDPFLAERPAAQVGRAVQENVGK
jgi:hypothetical protein